MTTRRFSVISRYLLPAIVLISLLMLLIPVSVVKADSVVTFSDPNLELAVRLWLLKFSGDIYESDLAGITYLIAPSFGITDLSGLEHCTSLKVLSLPSNQISDITPLASLTALTTLNLSDNQISDITPLAGLSDLISLNLSNNQIGCVASLAELTSLTSLNLDGNEISDITPLASLTALTTLSLSENQISGIAPLANMTSLTSLNLDSNDISDIAHLASLTQLTTLDLSENQISDITTLAGLTDLESLNLDDDHVRDVAPLVDNAGIKAGDTVYLRRDPLSNTSIDTWIPALQHRGVIVYWEAAGYQAPTQPSNVSPADAAEGVSITPTLAATEFSDPDDDDHEASQWQITTAPGNYSSALVFDSGTDSTHLTSITVPALSYSTTYYWRVRYQDSRLDWSLWSTETSFATVPSSPLVTTNDASSPTKTSARLNGELTWLGTASSVTVSFVRGTTLGGPYTNETASENMTTTGPFYFDLPGLNPGTTYYYQAKAVGDGDDYGNERSFTTSSLSAPSVTTSDATNVARTSATLNGDLTLLGTATSVDVSFEWGTATGSYSETTANQTLTASGAFSANLSALTPGTLYYYRAKAVGDVISYGDERSLTTSSLSAPLATTNDATSVGSTSATLNGNLTSLGTASSVIVSFEWGTADGGPYTSLTDNQTMTGTETFATNLTGLTPGTAYYYRAKAVGDGTVWGNQLTFTTSTTLPSVTTDDATSVTTTSATLNGALTYLGTASSVIVSFEWGTSTSYGSETTPQPISAIGTFNANLTTGLSANTTYNFRAKAVVDGSAVYGDDMSFTTASLADTTAPEISSVDSSNITVSGATITWTTNEAATSLVEYGLTEEYGSVTTEDTSLVTSHSVELTGLEAGKTYHYRVISKDGSNNQAVSVDATFTSAARPGGGMPTWAWVLIGLAAVGVVGAAGYLIKGRPAKR
jgi:phosphodiesterase/alkaline phosphatase D-like protein